VLPVVARLLPDLPRPLKNWGAPWLVREIPSEPQPFGANNSIFPSVEPPDFGLSSSWILININAKRRNVSNLPWAEFIALGRRGAIRNSD
jgi:hypothetical protein